MAFSPDGRTLAAGDYDGVVWLWDVADPAHPHLLGRALTGGGAVDSIAFSRGGSTLAVSMSGDELRLWDVADPAHPSPLSSSLTVGAAQPLSLAFSPDGQHAGQRHE